MFRWLSEFLPFARNYIVFTLLVALSLFLISLNNNRQVRNLQVVGTLTTSYLESGVQDVVGYFQLASVNRELEKANARLINMLARTRRAINENRQLKEMLNLKQQSSVPLIAAGVVGRVTDGGKNFVTINVGTKDGIQEGEPVMSGSGLVGTIYLAGEDFSIVRTLMDNSSRISARVVNDSTDGIVTAGEQGALELKDVSRRHHVRPGNIVETSTLSSISPPGIIIGTVTSASNRPGSIFKEVTLEPAVDFSSLSDVFVMKYRPSGKAAALESRALREKR